MHSERPSPLDGSLAMTSTHEALVTDQFGPRAAAYVTSIVHSQGADLDELVALVRGHDKARVLDLGCGGGHVGFHVAPFVREVVAYDLSEEMLRAVAGTARERGLGNVVTRCGAAEKLDMPEASFDFVFSRYSAHHWSDVGAALREARRVLAPGGKVVFIDVVAPERPLFDTFLQSIELLRDPSHVRNLSASQWQAALRAAGLVPGRTSARRLRLEFASWTARMRTPDLHAQAIRSLQAMTSREVKEHFEIEPDGSFTLDTMSFEAEPA
jgi:SAM-dependent methyltransferase